MQPATSVTSNVNLRSLSSAYEVTVNTPGSEPASLLPNTTTDVLFVVIVNDFDPEAPPVVTLEAGAPRSGVEGDGRGAPVQLNDQGTDGDLGAGDGLQRHHPGLDSRHGRRQLSDVPRHRR